MTMPGAHPKDLKSKFPGKNHPKKGLPTPRRTTETPPNRIKSREPVRFSAAC